MKWLTSDLDGTIYIEHTVSEMDLNSVNRFSEKNIFVISTGRNFKTFKKFENIFNLNYEYLILCNGALILDKYFNILHSSIMESERIIEKIYKIIDLQDLKNISLSVSFGLNALYFSELEGMSKKDIIAGIPSLINAISLEIASESPNLLEFIFSNLRNEFKYHIEKNNRYIDIVPCNVSKGSAINILLAQNRVNPTNLHVIGDSYNDVCMMKLTENSYVIKTAAEAVKVHATYEVDSITECIEIIGNTSCNID